MLRSQKLEIKSVEIRGRLSELAGLDSLEEDQRTELKEKTAELRQVEEQRVASLEVESFRVGARKRARTGRAPWIPRRGSVRKVLGKAQTRECDLRAVMDGKPLTGAEKRAEIALTDSPGTMRSLTNCSSPERRRISGQLPTLPRQGLKSMNSPCSPSSTRKGSQDSSGSICRRLEGEQRAIRY